VKLLLPFFCYTPTLAYNTHINNLGGVNSWEEEHFTHIPFYNLNNRTIFDSFMLAWSTYRTNS